MSKKRPQAVDSKQKRDEALNIADFKIDDILNVRGDQLLAEVSEDFGNPTLLAAEFDSIAFPVMSSHDNSAVKQGDAAVTLSVQQAAPGAASLRAFPRPSPATPWSFPRAALTVLAEWLAVALRHRIFLGTFATFLLVAALTPGIYPLLVNRSADQLATVSQDDPLTHSPAPTLPRPLPTRNPAPTGPAGQSPVAPPTEDRVQALRQPSSAGGKQLRTVTGGSDQAGGLVRDRQVSPLPSASVAPRALAPQSTAATELLTTPPAAAQAPVQAPAVAKSRLAEGGGFVVQLSASKSKAGAQSTFRALKSKYAVLRARELVIRRKDQGKRGVSYAVQVGPFESRDDAEQLCEHLKAAGGSCFIAKN